ncbi:serine hydrolase [Marinibaculum pumilum]|uniref:Serine hydrolase n=1 Tax=Marinibaculum pumilum TaxID=1766165 RepID=A0ABV7KVT2_9PROT
MTRLPSRAAAAIALAAAACLSLSVASRAEPVPASDLAPGQTPGIPVPPARIDAAVDRLDGLAEEILARSGIPGLAVAVVRDGQTVYAKGFGLRETGKPGQVDADTVFQLASLSKPVGATVVATQVGAGRIAWETPVVAHLPWFALSDPWVTDHVTVGDLYAHRSGLPDHAGDDLEDLGFDRRTVLERLRLLPLAPFRASYAYTNFGLTAAASAVAAAAGADWAALSEEAVYRPLGMSRTSSRFSDFAARENRAIGHVRQGDGFAALLTRQPDAQSPAGGVSSSAADMGRWMAMVLQDGSVDGAEVVPAKPLLAAVTPKAISKQADSDDVRPSLYGYGFGVGVEPSGRVVLSHSGAFAMGASTALLLIPSLDLGIVVLTNALPTGAAEALSQEFADLAQYGGITRDWYAGYARVMAPLSAPAGSLAGASAPAEPAPALDPADYAGAYENPYFGPLEIDVRDGALVMSVGPIPMRFPLRHWDGNRFVFVPAGENAPAGSLSAVDFAQDDAGRIAAVTVEVFDRAGQGRFVRP